MKKVREYFNELPEQYADIAILNADDDVLESECDSLISALMSGFIWDCAKYPENNSDNGLFWSTVLDAVISKTEFPEIPKYEMEEQLKKGNINGSIK